MPTRPLDLARLAEHVAVEPGGEIRLKGAYTYVEKREQPRIDDLDTSGKKKSGGSTPAPKK